MIIQESNFINFTIIITCDVGILFNFYKLLIDYILFDNS